MDFSKIPTNSVIITLPNLKRKLVKKISATSLKNIKVMTLSELREKFYFSYNEQAIYYLMNKYGYVIEVAKMYLTRMYDISITSSNIPKVQKIIDLKNELLNNNLLIFLPYFKEYLKRKTIIFYECHTLDKSDQKMLDDISRLSQTMYLNEPNITYSNDYIYEFKTIEEEVVYVASRICELIKQGLSFNKIKLYGVIGEYSNIIKRIFSWYNIPIVFSDNYLYSTAIVQDYLNELNENEEQVLKYLEKKYDLTNPKTLTIYNKIISIHNKYIWADSYLNIKDFLIADFKQTAIEPIHYQEEVEIITSLKAANTDDWVFMLGFNQGDIPKTHKDESYFNDTIKQKLGLETTKELNQRLYQQCLNEIRQTKNLIITTKLTSSLGEHYLSSLNDDLNLEIKRPKTSYSYSNIHNKLLLGEKLDSYIKYGEKERDLDLLYSNYPDISYSNYSNNYTPINKEKIQKYLNNRLVLSYSAMNTYYQCSFRYYLANILKLNIFEETFYTIIGNLFHYILSIAFKREIDLEKEYDSYLEKYNYSFNSREKFFLNNLKKELEFIIKTINKQNEANSLNKTYCEEKIEVDKSQKNMEITFKGFVDKLITDEKEGTVAIVDYKTGNPDLNLNNIIYGLDLQLPVYVYLARKKFPSANIAGFYLQKILNNEISKDYKHSYETLKEEKLKLQGYSNSNISILERFDSSYNESKMIKGMRTSSKGLGTKKVLRSEQIDELENITERKIDEAIDSILNANFNINPKRVGMNNLGCKFCEFKDICFFTEKNIENLKEYKNMEFLGGADNDTEETD